MSYFIFKFIIAQKQLLNYSYETFVRGLLDVFSSYFQDLSLNGQVNSWPASDRSHWAETVDPQERNMVNNNLIHNFLDFILL